MEINSAKNLILYDFLIYFSAIVIESQYCTGKEHWLPSCQNIGLVSDT